ITVTAATQENDSLTISYTGTASGSTTADASRSGGITTFSKTISSLGAGTYEFTLTHSNGTTGAVAGVELTEGQAATITGYLDNGTWQVGLVTINIYSVAVDANITNGSVTADVAGAAPGDKVVLYVEPDDGYILSTISVNSGAVSTTDISDANGVAYTFTMPDADVTVTGTFASAPTYAITTGSAEHGSVTADVAGAAPGDKVVLYVEPDDGYLLTSITVAGTSGNVETTAIKAGTYKFTMPNTDVTVAATFSDLYTSTPFDRSSVAIGDVVLEDGRTVTVANYADYKAAYDLADGAPVGVVAYTGTTGTAGITGKVYMLGLSRRSLLKWAPSGTTGYTTKFSTSLTAGEGNWGVITSADSTGSADAATNYPAFNYANTYNAGGNYTSGWFLPSFQELRLISSGNATGSGTTRRNTLNNSLNAIISAGVTANALPTSGHVWSSSQSSSDNNYAHTVYFYDGSTNVKTKDYVSEQYLGSVNVLVVRALD
ncbi:MAG: hypothetical protein II958_02850, partial [Spirochaetia bacterium]|nr:hypothetical protein [Spirochaetia bacterium]